MNLEPQSITLLWNFEGEQLTDLHISAVAFGLDFDLGFYLAVYQRCRDPLASASVHRPP